MPAMKAASKKAAEKRQIKIDEIRRVIFCEFCTCGRCANGNYSELCITLTDLAGTLNTLEIETLRGKTGSWQATTVKNLVSHQDNASQSPISKLFS